MLKTTLPGGDSLLLLSIIFLRTSEIKTDEFPRKFLLKEISMGYLLVHYKFNHWWLYCCYYVHKHKDQWCQIYVVWGISTSRTFAFLCITKPWFSDWFQVRIDHSWSDYVSSEIIVLFQATLPMRCPTMVCRSVLQLFINRSMWYSLRCSLWQILVSKVDKILDSSQDNFIFIEICRNTEISENIKLILI